MARVSKKELDGAITKTKSSKVTDTRQITNQSVGEVIYDKAGTEVDVLPSDQIMAKQITSGNHIKYMMRVNRRNELYNPHDKNYAAESYRIARSEGTSPFELINCTKAAFDMYLSFLRSANIRYLEEAQRGI